MNDLWLFGTALSGAVFAALVLMVGGNTLYRVTWRWSDASVAGVLLGGIALGAIVQIVSTPRTLTVLSEMQSTPYVSEGGGWGIWVARILTAALLVFAAVTAIKGWLESRRASSSGGSSVLPAIALLWVTTALSDWFLSTEPDVSLKALYQPVVFLALYTSVAFDPVRVLHFSRAMVAVPVMGSLLVAAAAPDFSMLRPYPGLIPGIDFRLYGITPHANSLGALAVLLLVIEYACPRNLLVRLPMTVVSILALALSQSKTAWIALVLIASFVGLPKWMAARRKIGLGIGSATIAASIVGIVGGCGAALIVFAGPDWVSDREVLTLTGRTTAWQITLREWSENPIFGYGPQLWGTEFRVSRGLLWAGQAHNQFVHTLGGSGLVGLVSLIAYISVLGVASIRQFAASGGLTAALFILIVCRCISEAPLRVNATILGWEVFTHCLLFLFICHYARESAKAGSPGSTDSGKAPISPDASFAHSALRATKPITRQPVIHGPAD